MPKTKPMSVTCTRCAASAPLPEDRHHSALWDGGWRWIGPDLMSCPDCPPVIAVAEDGRHLRGPGAAAAH
ncbi:hypothetical protein [Streptomyces sp. NPDC058657]|uniref:hypothetical protein n=1 Tax=unclassified Streptomyces TaxID=2593676 RepID=UPI00364A5204